MSHIVCHAIVAPPNVTAKQYVTVCHSSVAPPNVIAKQHVTHRVSCYSGATECNCIVACDSQVIFLCTKVNKMFRTAGKHCKVLLNWKFYKSSGNSYVLVPRTLKRARKNWLVKKVLKVLLRDAIGCTKTVTRKDICFVTC